MSKTLAMFPGQGSQSVGMGQELLNEFSYVKNVFEEAEDSIKVKIRDLCFEGPEDELRLTENQQPCILTVSIAKWHILQKETDFKPDFFAGHSLGEYSALVAAGKLNFAEAVSLVKQRGAAMQRAVPEGKGAMAAILNFDAEKLVGLCSKVTAEMKGSVEAVNFNSPKQQIISGSKDEVETVVNQLTGVDKVRTAMLPVSAPFHSSMMAPAREEMTPLLKAAKLIGNDTKVIANLTGKLAEPYDTEMLIKQIDNPVLWTQSLETSVSLDINQYIEVGPGKVLFGLARKTLSRDMTLMNTDDMRKSIEVLNS